MTTRKLCVAVFSLLVVACLMALLLSAYRTATPPALPVPNGYDDFVKAAQRLSGNPRDYRSMTLHELRALLTTNAETLDLLRTGLAKQSQVPMTYATNINAHDAHLDYLAKFKGLAQLLVAEGGLAKEEGRTNDAVRIYLDEIRFAHEICRGGVIIDRLVGLACEGIGMKAFQKLIDNLDAETCRVAVVRLQEIDRGREPVEDVLRNEQEWRRRNFPFWQRLPAMIPITALNPVKQVEKNFVKKFKQSDLELKQVMIESAVRAYYLDHGKRPKSAEDLVPAYLNAVPLDPTTGTNLSYLP